MKHWVDLKTQQKDYCGLEAIESERRRERHNWPAATCCCGRLRGHVKNTVERSRVFWNSVVPGYAVVGLHSIEKGGRRVICRTQRTQAIRAFCESEGVPDRETEFRRVRPQR